jgi:hypothetical protein
VCERSLGYHPNWARGVERGEEVSGKEPAGRAEALGVLPPDTVTIWAAATECSRVIVAAAVGDTPLVGMAVAVIVEARRGILVGPVPARARCLRDRLKKWLVVWAGRRPHVHQSNVRVVHHVRHLLPRVPHTRATAACAVDLLRAIGAAVSVPGPVEAVGVASDRVAHVALPAAQLDLAEGHVDDFGGRTLR